MRWTRWAVPVGLVAFFVTLPMGAEARMQATSLRSIAIKFVELVEPPDPDNYILTYVSGTIEEAAAGDTYRIETCAGVRRHYAPAHDAVDHGCGIFELVIDPVLSMGSVRGTVDSTMGTIAVDVSLQADPSGLPTIQPIADVTRPPYLYLVGGYRIIRSGNPYGTIVSSSLGGNSGEEAKYETGELSRFASASYSKS